MENIENIESLHQKLKETRERSGLSQNEVANRLNISRQAISRWENGKTSPDIKSLYLLSQIYGVTVNELIGIENENLNENADVKTDTDNYTDGDKNHIDSNIIEEILLGVIITLSCLFPVVGLIIPIAVLIWMKKRLKRYKLLFLIIILCLLSNIHTTLGFFNAALFQIGTSNITPI